eukprot:TRINITY_DN34212_c0_g1_i1.p1 TRINITY_DN34212_c0_g1~~TRINITY_DN34212_c0_g1_i1.p1  ORF type:complete len:167 (-),score=23.66 TRINITY_DN34212_c0_g1_i1:54-554(-)
MKKPAARKASTHRSMTVVKKQHSIMKREVDGRTASIAMHPVPVRVFRNFQEACAHYRFPGLHRIGTVGNANGVVRSFSNPAHCKDKFLKQEVHYRIKDANYRSKFERNMETGQLVRFFTKAPLKESPRQNRCLDLGLFRVAGFVKAEPAAGYAHQTEAVRLIWAAK